MFAVVTTEREFQNIVIPVKWIKSVNLFETGKDGVNCEQKCIFFHSKDKTKGPDFSTEISVSFDLNGDCCYIGFIRKYFGEICCFISVFFFKYRNAN